MQVIDTKKDAPTFHSAGVRGDAGQRRKPSVAESREKREQVVFWMRVVALACVIACLLLAFVYGVIFADGLFSSAIEVLSR